MEFALACVILCLSFIAGVNTLTLIASYHGLSCIHVQKNRIYICVKDETGFTFSVTACVILWLESVADETEFKNL